MDGTRQSYGSYRFPRIALWLLCLWFQIPFVQSASAFDGLDRSVNPKDLPRFVKPLSIYNIASPDYSSGGFSYSFPIDVPPAKGSSVPSLSLRYDSRGQAGPLGLGWSIGGVDYIEPSRARGVPETTVPACNGNDDDQFLYSIGDETGKLVYIKSTAEGHLYKARVEKNLFAKFYYVPSSDSCWRRILSGSCRPRNSSVVQSAGAGAQI